MAAKASKDGAVEQRTDSVGDGARRAPPSARLYMLHGGFGAGERLA